MKLSDLLFTQGFGTRYDCRALAASGEILVNGKPLEGDPDREVTVEGFVFEWQGRLWPYFEKAVIALNKPVGYECSLKPSSHPSVMSLLPGPLRRRGVQPVGRLDVETSGLLILTDDGKFLHKVTHPKHHVKKVYRAELKHPFDEGLCQRLLDGVLLAGESKPVKALAVRQLAPQELELVIDQGKYHQVRRMVAACGNRVVGLQRTAFGKMVMPPDLPEGSWIWISKEHILN